MSSEDNVSAGHLSQGLQITASLIQGLLGEIRDNSIALAAFNAEVKNMRETVNLLSKILKDGNGTPSVVTKISIIEGDIQRIQNGQRELSDKVTALTKRFDDTGREERIEEIRTNREQKSQRLQFWASIIAAVLALVATLLTVLLK